MSVHFLIKKGHFRYLKMKVERGEYFSHIVYYLGWFKTSRIVRCADTNSAQRLNEDYLDGEGTVIEEVKRI